MKNLEFNIRIIKIIKNHRIQYENNENHKIPLEHHEHHENQVIPCENDENIEEIWITYENLENHEILTFPQENHEIHIIPCRNNAIMKLLISIKDLWKSWKSTNFIRNNKNHQNNKIPIDNHKDNLNIRITFENN